MGLGLWDDGRNVLVFVELLSKVKWIVDLSKPYGFALRGADIMASEVVQKETKWENGWLVWSVEGRIDISTADLVYQSGEEIVGREEKTVLDMSKVTYISSAGLRVLLRLLKKAKKEGREFTVAGASGVVETVLTDSNMDTLLNMRKSLDEL